jgi:hypothetical protein
LGEVRRDDDPVESSSAGLHQMELDAPKRDLVASKRRGKFPHVLQEASTGTVLTNLHPPSAVSVRDRAPLPPLPLSRVLRVCSYSSSRRSLVRLLLACLHDSSVGLGSLWRREPSALSD